MLVSVYRKHFKSFKSLLYPTVTVSRLSTNTTKLLNRREAKFNPGRGVGHGDPSCQVGSRVTNGGTPLSDLSDQEWEGGVRSFIYRKNNVFINIRFTLVYYLYLPRRSTGDPSTGWISCSYPLQNGSSLPINPFPFIFRTSRLSCIEQWALFNPHRASPVYSEITLTEINGIIIQCLK